MNSSSINKELRLSTSQELRIQNLERELKRAKKELQHVSITNKETNRSLRTVPVEIEEDIHRLNELFFSSSSLMAILVGEDFIVKMANDSFLKSFGRSKEIIGQAYLEAIPELKEQGFGEHLRKVYKTGIPYRATEFPVYIMKEGKSRLTYFDFVYQAHRNINGEINGVGIIATEVTTQAHLNKKIKKSERKLRQLTDLIPDLITNSDKNGKAFYYNKSWLEFSGMSLEELLDIGWALIMHPDETDEFQRTLAHSLKSGEDFEMELRFKNSNGIYIWHLCRANAIFNDDNEIESWISTNTEIQRIKLEEKRKDDFLKMVSHELKTPITSIRGYVQMLISMVKMDEIVKNSPLPLESSLTRIDNQISRLIRLISEMLDLNRIDDSQLVLNKKTFSLNNLLEDTIQDVQISSPSTKINLEHNCECNVYADKDRIEQVIINFITNAIKYSPDDNRVDIKVYFSKANKASVSVRDYGIGIDKVDYKKIFKRFYRVSGKNEETYSGFGIGLFLAKDIIERHNGTVLVKSKKGKGSEFIFTLNEITD